MSEMLGQPVVVEGRVGGGGVVAATATANAKPDGYTIMLVAAGFAAGVGLHKSLPYDPVNDFTFISMVTRIGYVIAARPDGPYKTIAELVAAAKAQPGKIHYATGGVGTGIHLTMELFLARAGLQMEHVPYRGGTTQVQALLSGDVPVLVDTPTPIVGQVEAGKIKPLAISSKTRWVRWPDVPTIDETVLPGFEVAGWLGVMGPKGLPGADPRAAERGGARGGRAARGALEAARRGDRRLDDDAGGDAELRRERHRALDQGDPGREDPAGRVAAPAPCAPVSRAAAATTRATPRGRCSSPPA